MTKFERVQALIVQELAPYREHIENSEMERVEVAIRFKPYGGLPRAVEVKLIRACENHVKA